MIKFILSVTLLCAVSTNAQMGRAPPQMRGAGHQAGPREIHDLHHEHPRSLETPSACDPATFDAGWGNCSTYHPDLWMNYDWCTLDCMDCGCASDTCAECSAPTTAPTFGYDLPSSMGPTTVEPCDPATFDAGWGNCSTYHPDQDYNYEFCAEDCIACGCASYICAECSVPTTAPTFGIPTPTTLFNTTCADPFDAGWGTCETYDPDQGYNYAWCESDCDDCGNCASETCSECSEDPTEPTCADPFDAGWGTCETYHPDQGYNYEFCLSDCDACGKCASWMCAECDVTTIPPSLYPTKDNTITSAPSN